MKCIDAIEGTVKCILHQWHGLYVEYRLEDLEYVRNVKSVIDGTSRFLADNPEVVENPKLLIDELFTYSRELWLSCQPRPDDHITRKKSELDGDTMEYRTYLYNYLYHQGLYPR